MWHLLMAHQQESFLPLSSRQSLFSCLSRVAKRSTPKPHGPLYSPSEVCGPFPHFRTAWSSSFPLRTSWFSPIHSRNVWPPIYFRTTWSSLSMAARPRFKSQRPSSFAAPFLTPPTTSYTCQHPCILPALLGCHSKSGQVWPHAWHGANHLHALTQAL